MLKGQTLIIFILTFVKFVTKLSKYRQNNKILERDLRKDISGTKVKVNILNLDIFSVVGFRPC